MLNWFRLAAGEQQHYWVFANGDPSTQSLYLHIIDGSLDEIHKFHMYDGIPPIVDKVKKYKYNEIELRRLVSALQRYFVGKISTPKP